MSQSVDNFDPFVMSMHDQRRYYQQNFEQTFDPSYNTIQGQYGYYHPGTNELTDNHLVDFRSSSNFNMYPSMNIRQGYAMNHSMNYNKAPPMRYTKSPEYFNDPMIHPSKTFFNSPMRQQNQEMFQNNTLRNSHMNPSHALLTDRGHNTNENWMSKMSNNYKIPKAVFGLKKGGSSVQKFRRNNILRSKSKVININGVNKNITTELYNQLQNI